MKLVWHLRVMDGLDDHIGEPSKATGRWDRAIPMFIAEPATAEDTGMAWS